MGNWPAPPQSSGLRATPCTIRVWSLGFRVLGFSRRFGLKCANLPIPLKIRKMYLPHDSCNEATLEDLGRSVL